MGNVDLSNLPSLSDLKLPNIADVNLPSVDNWKMPDMPAMPSLPSSLGNGGEGVTKLLDSTGSSGSNTLIVVGTAFVLFLGVMAVTASAMGADTEGGQAGSRTVLKKKQKSKVNLLAIDYHAPARLAYQEWLSNHPDEKANADAYAVFEALYEANAVALATSKKIARDLEAFDNKPAKPVPPRTIMPKKTTPPPTKSGTFFFASE